MRQAAVSNHMSLKEWGLLLFLSLLWGGSFFFIGTAVKELPVLIIVALRLTTAAIILNCVLLIRGEKLPLNRATIIAFFGMGLLGNALPFSLISWGQTHIASGLASILNATTPLFTVLVMHFFSHDERLNASKLMGVLLGFAGVVLMIGTSAFAGFNGSVLGQIAVLCAAISYGFSGIFGRRFKTLRVSPLVTATGMVSAASLMLLPLALILDKPWQHPMPSTHVIVAMVCLAVFSTSLAYLVFFRILASAGMTNVVLVTLLAPIFAITLGVWQLGERLEMKHYLGMALVGCGLAVMDGRLVKFVLRR